MAEPSLLPAGEPAAGISRGLAAWRTAHYRDVRYALRIELLPPFERVTGTLALDVTLEQTPPDLVLDWRGDSPDHALRDLRVNGRPVEPIPYANEHLVVPRTYLRAGINRIEVEFSAPVRAAGTALTRYRDAND